MGLGTAKNRVRCIAFDLDDTLWACAPVIQQAEQALYNWLAEHYPKLIADYTLPELIAQRQAYAHQHPEWHYDLSLLRKQWLNYLAIKHQCDLALVEPAFAVFQQTRNQVILFPEVFNQLQRLKPHYILATITNGNAEINNTVLAGLFDFNLTAAQAGVSKPDVGIFRQAVELARVSAAEMVYIGDDLEKDIIGAEAAGLKTIWYNPEQRELPAAIKTNAVMKNFTELEKLIQLL